MRWAVLTAVVLAWAGACSSGHDPGSAKKSPPAAVITPANGAAQARPDRGVQVRAAAGGVLRQVSVRGAGRAAEGGFSADKTSWQTRWTLRPNTRYTVTAVAKDEHGRTETVTSTFTTLKPSAQIRVSDVTPGRNETVGVGMPIIVDFSGPVYNQAEVERALEVRSTTPVEGAWKWVGRQQVIFRPKTYWPAHTQVSLVAHMTGVRAAKNVYGIKDATRGFSVGPSHIAKVNLKSHKEKVYVDDKLAKTIPVSGGMGGSDSHGNDFRTTGGVHLAMGKYPKLWFTSPNIKKGEPGYYHELVYKDVQISNSGEYLHRSPGELSCLGVRNCSHGCVRQTAAGAAWFYTIAQRGDVIDITGTSRDLDWNNGWGYWQLSFDTWVEGGAQNHSVTTGRMAGATPDTSDQEEPGSGQSTPAPGVN